MRHSQSETRNTGSSWRNVVLRAGGSGAILAALLWFLPAADLWAAVQRVPGSVLILALAGYLATHLAGVFKWRLMVNLAGGGLGWGLALRCYSAGLFGNLFLPSIVGGDLVRAGLGMRNARSASGVVAGSLADRLADILGLGALAAIGVLLAPIALESAWIKALGIFAAVLVLFLAAAGILFKLRPIRRLVDKIAGRTRAMLEATKYLAGRPKYLLLALIIGMGMQLSLIFLTASIGWACGLDVGFHVWLFAWPLAKLSALLPVTQGGIGIREAALGALLAPFGAPVVLTVAVGLVWEVVLIAGALIGGLISLLLPAGSLEQGAESLAGVAAKRSET